MLRIGIALLLSDCEDNRGVALNHHKSGAKLAPMTPEQRIQEYCDEYYENAFEDFDYCDLLESFVLAAPARR